MRTSVSDMRDYVVCPKPRRLGVLHSTFNDPQPVRSLRWSLSHQSEALDSRAASDLFDIIIPKMHQRNISQGSSYLSTTTEKKHLRSSRSIKGKGIAIHGPHLFDSIENAEDYERFEKDASEWEDIMSKRKSSSHSLLVIPPNKKKRPMLFGNVFLKT